MAPTLESLDKKLDSIMKGQAVADKQFAELRELLAANHARVTVVEEQMSSMLQEIKSLKETVNLREQQVRSLSIRVVGLPNQEDENTPKLIYDRVIKPMLVAAKEKNIIASVPQLSTAVLEAYRIRPRGGAVPSGSHPIRVKLATPALKSALFRVKKEALPGLSEQEKAAGHRRILMVEELTPAAYDLLRRLRDDSRVSRAWSVEGRIKLVKTGDNSSTVLTVKSIFDPVSTILA